MSNKYYRYRIILSDTKYIPDKVVSPTYSNQPTNWLLHWANLKNENYYCSLLWEYILQWASPASWTPGAAPPTTRAWQARWPTTAARRRAGTTPPPPGRSRATPRPAPDPLWWRRLSQVTEICSIAMPAQQYVVQKQRSELLVSFEKWCDWVDRWQQYEQQAACYPDSWQ